MRLQVLAVVADLAQARRLGGLMELVPDHDTEITGYDAVADPAWRARPPDVVLVAVDRVVAATFERVVQVRDRFAVPLVAALGEVGEAGRVVLLDGGVDAGVEQTASPVLVRSVLRAAVSTARRSSARSAQTPEQAAAGVVRMSPQAAPRARPGLSDVELQALGALVESRGRVVSRQALQELLWPDQPERDPRTVDQVIRRVRRKLQARLAPVRIAAVRNVGFCLTSTDRAEAEALLPDFHAPLPRRGTAMTQAAHDEGRPGWPEPSWEPHLTH